MSRTRGVAVGYALAAALWALPGAAAEPEPRAAIEATLASLLPGVPVERIAPAPVAGLYAAVAGGRVLYLSPDGRYLFFGGHLYDTRERADLSEALLGAVRRDVLAGVPDERTIVFEPDGPARRTVSVFTDIDCPYCRKLHGDMAKLNAAGVRVRYLLFPRAGLGSESHRKAVSVWCAGARSEALTAAKAGGSPPTRRCDNPVEAHMALAERLGVTATPTSITPDGAVVRGYASAEAYLHALGLEGAETGR